MTLVVQNYRCTQIQRVSNGENLASAFRDMPPAISGAPTRRPAVRSSTAIPLQSEGRRVKKVPENNAYYHTSQVQIR